MGHRFLLWVIAAALSIWISIAMVAAPGVALAAPDAGSDSDGAESSEPAKPTKPAKQHKPAKTRAEKKADAGGSPSGSVGSAKDDAKDQAAEPKTDPTKTGPPAGDVTGTDRESDGKIPTTSGPAVDKDAAEDVGEDAKEAVAEDVPVTSEPEPDPSGSEDTIVPEPVVKTGEGHSAAAAQRADSRADGSGTLSPTGVEAGTVEENTQTRTTAADLKTEPGAPTAGTAAPIAAGETAFTKVDAVASLTEKTSASTVVTFAAAAPAAETVQRKPTLLNVIGTLIFSALEFVTKILEGPPSVPAGSTVTVGRSKLQIDCGDGYTVDADWYFPTDDQPPTGLIYLQHGFAARAGFYNTTAAELAERTHSIVVAPSLSSNLFACDSCQLGGDPLHYAVAKLFSGDREALTASASAAAGYDVVLPQRYVIAGHSGGGQLAAGAAGYAAQIAQVTGAPLDLAGVLLLDTSEVGGAVSRGIAKIPTDIPVLYITSEPSVLNDFGSVDAVLEAARPGQFNGVRLVGGTHSDAIQTTNSIVEFAFSLLTGVSRPENIDAVRLLAGGWVRDMFAGTVYDEDERTGIYGDLGSLIEIPTDNGTASAYVLPAPPHKFTLIDLVLRAFIESTNALRFGYCAVDPDVELQQGADAARSAGQPACAVSELGEAV